MTEYACVFARVRERVFVSACVCALSHLQVEPALSPARVEDELLRMHAARRRVQAAQYTRPQHARARARACMRACLRF